MSMSIHVCAPHACLVLVEGVESPRPGVMDDFELPCAHWKQNLDPLAEQQVFLTTETSLQAHIEPTLAVANSFR